MLIFTLCVLRGERPVEAAALVVVKLLSIRTVMLALVHLFLLQVCIVSYQHAGWSVPDLVHWHPQEGMWEEAELEICSML